LERVRLVEDIRVEELTEHWRAIQGADTDERGFCTIAGRMGIDPYHSSEMTDALARFLEQSTFDADDPLVRDLTEVAQPDSITEQWSWLSSVSRDLELRPGPVDLSFVVPPRGSAPPQFGYRLARLVRDAAQVLPGSPLDSIETVASDVIGRRLRIEPRNRLPGRGIRAIVGKSAKDGDIVAAGPQLLRTDSQRFLIARSLYHAIVTAQNSLRLVTNAFSWDQQASRAFAAELLAPQRTLVERVSSSGADSALVVSLSH
jgi:hypothetical protein